VGGEVFLSVTTLVLVDDRCTCFGLAVGTLPHPHAKKGGGPAGGMLVFFEHLGFRGMSTRGVMMFSRWPCWISTSANWSSRRNEGADVRKHPSFQIRSHRTGIRSLGLYIQWRRNLQFLL
jgi:hypothetical protein